MNIAKSYGLNFIVTQTKDFKPKPSISHDKDALGNSRNIEMGDFISGMGVELTSGVIFELQSWNLSSQIDGESVEGSPEQTVELFSSPPRAGFWSGSTASPGYYYVPLQDLLDILQEWIDFLNGLSFEHWLSNI